MPETTPLLVAIMGPTGSGKSDVAESVATELDLQLINADAFMVYRGFDIGTNKPSDRARYKILDFLEPDADFGVGEWVAMATDILAGLWEEGRGAVVVGGTGLYVRALFEEYEDLMPAPDPGLRVRLMEREESEGLESLAQELLERDPKSASTVDLDNPVRVRRALERLYDDRPPIKIELPPFKRLKFALDPPVVALNARIEGRVRQMFDSGWEDEVAGLLSLGVKRNAPAFRAIGYDCIVDLLEGGLDLAETERKIVTETRQYAKRQRTWLRSEPGTVRIPLEDLCRPDAERAAEQVIDYLNSLGSQDG